MSGHSKFANIKHKKEKNDAAMWSVLQKTMLQGWKRSQG